MCDRDVPFDNGGVPVGVGQMCKSTGHLIHGESIITVARYLEIIDGIDPDEGVAEL